PRSSALYYAKKRAALLPQLANSQVADFDLHGLSTVELQREDPRLAEAGLILVDRQSLNATVYDVRKDVAVGDDRVVGPVVPADCFLELVGMPQAADLFDLRLLGVVAVRAHDHCLAPLRHEHPAVLFEEHPREKIAGLASRGVVMPAGLEVGLQAVDV